MTRIGKVISTRQRDREKKIKRRWRGNKNKILTRRRRILPLKGESQWY